MLYSILGITIGCPLLNTGVCNGCFTCIMLGNILLKKCTLYLYWNSLRSILFGMHAIVVGLVLSHCRKLHKGPDYSNLRKGIGPQLCYYFILTDLVSMLKYVSLVFIGSFSCS